MQKYIQQILVPEIGIEGQNLISQAKVLVIGAGGLGTPLCAYLAAMGIGTLAIADGDIVSESNLHRQFLYCYDDLGKKKVDVLKKTLIVTNPGILIKTYDLMVAEDLGIEFIFKEYDIICDCTDNIEARLLIDKLCSETNKVQVYGAVRDWQGYVTILNGKNKIRLTDIFSYDKLQSESQNNCSVSGIVSSVCGIIGSFMATETIKIITNQQTGLDGSILCINALYNSNKVFKIKKIQIK